MKLFLSIVTTALFGFISSQSLASSEIHPEAFAGLSHDAFNRLELNNKSNQLSFELDGELIGLPFSITKSSTGHSTNVSFTWTLPNGYISATKGENSLFGQMHLNNKHFILTTNQAGIWAVELPPTGLSFNDCGFAHGSSSDQAKNTAYIAQSNLSDKAAGTIVDVLILHDSAISNRYPGALLQARVDQYLHVTNQTFANSGIDLAVRQVGLELTNYNFDDSNINLLEQLQQSIEIGVGSQGLSNVPQLRADSGADLVIFLRTMDIEKRGNCGVAYYPLPIDNNNFDSSYGVNILADGMSSWSICTDQLMAHEIGHNLGAGHHNTEPEDRFLPDGTGFAKLGQYGTVMGSFGTGDANRFYELDYFSNPAVQCGGSPCGVTGLSNNTRVINQLKTVVANYQNSLSNAPLPADFGVALTDLDSDGVLDRDDEFPFHNTETTDTDGDGVGDNSDAFPTNPNETADFDEDGLGDNSDPDGDNDGVDNISDVFDFDPSETEDSDRDGVGNNADDFEFEAAESKDSDGDGTGNNADLDDDNDGVIDIDTTKQDLLVISVGNNRMLRFDAQTGLAKGIEVLPNDGLFTFQSDLTYDENFKRLFFTSASSVKTLDLMNPYATPKLLISPYYNPAALTNLNTGFPLAIEANEQALDPNGTTDLFWTKIGRSNAASDVRGFSIGQNTLSTYAFPFFSAFAQGENIIDIERVGQQFYFLGQVNSVYRSTREVFDSEILGNGNYSWLVDPYAMVATDDGRLIHSDQARNKLVITNIETASYGGIFADLATLGYSNPTGMDITKDGRLLVAVSDQNTILQFNLDSQEFLGELIVGGGMNQPHKMLLVPQLADRFNQDKDKVLRPNAGNWFNPATSGRGFNIGVFDNRLQVLWFTYDDDGLPIWYTSADFLLGHEFDTELLKTKMDFDGSVSIESIGHINITFDNERAATMRWQIGDDMGEEAIYWLQFSGEPESINHTGMWSRPDTPGWGTAVITNGDKTVMIPFIYDEDGEPRWVISNVSESLSQFDLDMVAVFSDTLCPSCSGEPDSTIVEAGSMEFDLSGNPYWSSDLTWPSPVAGSWQLDQTAIIRISSVPTKPR
ncbi:M12 family metallo-peptidase [Marinicella litoralis]|uniref:Reprolysin-like metallo-peptidase family M12B n=1 Tax=Marinicella litoralis TaxID=644220 RepID=A0A4R6XTA3_9GAMM|nr:zinc-dependent metalloprotease family protein [Marinicella litoralis]TDR23182.1 reprolysin-like metallo-peptidase family M12B [Marinicella litoralis]